MGDDATRELSRIMVPVEIDHALRRIKAETGAPISWQRRKAYAEYIARYDPARPETYPAAPRGPR